MKRMVISFLTCMAVVSSYACTTFCINHNGQIVFGRNYDWVTGAGIVYTNHRGLFKTSKEASDGATTSWVSKYGSISFNQYGKEFPTGGMNEKGLVVELMWLEETVYPAKDARASLMILQWIQYQLDNSSSVAEVIATDASVRISSSGSPLHYQVAEAAGNVATIEFLDGKMVVHKGKELSFPLLTNSTYSSSAATVRSSFNRKNISLSDNSLDRFVKACGMIKQLKDSNVTMPLTDYAFSILDRVSQGSFTKWSIVYDISKKNIYFKTNEYTAIKILNFSGFDLSCNKPSKMFNMNQQTIGNINAKFTLLDTDLKRKLLDQAV
ncbi:MAG: linear amide C-N hydrolase, partial [Chitinophagaceae bacterium]|nr:linear amide C-N hydrolase [Chitinophagaceae bacterium]